MMMHYAVCLLQEIQALAACGTHPNVVRYFTSWVEEQRNVVHFYIQLERCGSSLGQRFCVDRRPFKEAELVDILRQVCCSFLSKHSCGCCFLRDPQRQEELRPSSSWRLVLS